VNRYTAQLAVGVVIPFSTVNRFWHVVYIREKNELLFDDRVQRENIDVKLRRRLVYSGVHWLGNLSNGALNRRLVASSQHIARWHRSSWSLR
jgi:hypothetical protein